MHCLKLNMELSISIYDSAFKMLPLSKSSLFFFERMILFLCLELFKYSPRFVCANSLFKVLGHKMQKWGRKMERINIDLFLNTKMLCFQTYAGASKIAANICI